MTSLQIEALRSVANAGAVYDRALELAHASDTPTFHVGLEAARIAWEDAKAFAELLSVPDSLIAIASGEDTGE